LLLDPEDNYGFFRHWVPEEMGPGRHYAYALQWFAMGIVLAGLLIWNFRKRGLES
jgi:cytochrome oxidase assembly protein ShyY1